MNPKRQSRRVKVVLGSLLCAGLMHSYPSLGAEPIGPDFVWLPSRGDATPPRAPIVPGKEIQIKYVVSWEDQTVALTTGTITATISQQSRCQTSDNLAAYLNASYLNISNLAGSNRRTIPLAPNISFEVMRVRDIGETGRGDISLLGAPDAIVAIKHGLINVQQPLQIKSAAAGKKLCIYPAAVRLSPINTFKLASPAYGLNIQVPNTVTGATLGTPSIWFGHNELTQGGSTSWYNLRAVNLEFSVKADSALMRGYQAPSGETLRARKIIIFFPKTSQPLATNGQGIYDGAYTLDSRTNLILRNNTPWFAAGPNINGLRDQVYVFSKSIASGGENPYSPFGCKDQGWNCAESSNPTPKLNLGGEAQGAVTNLQERDPNSGTMRYGYVCAHQYVQFYSPQPAGYKHIISKPRCIRIAPD